MSALWRPELSPDHEPHRVLLIRDQLIDESRGGRVIPIKVYYPVNHSLTGLPVVFWAHGLGGSVDGAAFLSRFLASHGYIVVHTQHAGTDSGLWEGKPGHPWDIIRNTKIPRQAALDRFADIPFVLDTLGSWMAQHPDIAAHADLSRLGMSGHSFGAMTTQVMGGMLYPDETGTLRSFREPRFTAGILYSPVPISHITPADPQELYGPIALPLMHMTGTQDDSPVEKFGFKERVTIYENSRAEKHLLVLKDGDHMVFAGSRGKLGQNPNREAHEAIIKAAALAFWEAKLKENKSAEDWLTGGGFGTYLKDGATYTFER